MTIHSAQWRLAEVQLANWGTFDGRIYRIGIARKGHLITGPSGSGKSSLLDAIAAVMTPDKWLSFNQAAQGAGARSDQRKIISYIRGAWSKTTDEVDDRVVSTFLRPRATWSGIVLRFENGVDAPVSLCRLFLAKGTSTEWNDLCLLDRSSVDLAELQEYVAAGVETRKVQARWPDAVTTTNGGHARFYARMRSIFGIEHENALQLLHKTQSAKSLDSLDQLFRDFMLDRPETFDIAENAVAQFGELRDAHDHVVQLRLQRDHLLKLEAASRSFDLATAEATRARTLAESVVPYQRRESLRLSRDERAELDGLLAELRERVRSTQATFSIADAALAEAQLRERQLGGDTDQLRQRIATARAAEAATSARFDQFALQLDQAGVHAPSSAVEFAELMATIDGELLNGANAEGASWEQNDRVHSARRARDTLAAEIDDLRHFGSAVPGSLLAVRDRIAAELKLARAALPFAAELLEVRPEHAAWAGAIERVLRPLALTLLVRSEHSHALRRWVDGHHLGARLVFEDVTPNSPPPRPVSSDRSLVHRVSVSDGPFAPWLQSQLSDRFDVACVDSPDEFDQHVRAVTINGQVKVSRTRYEKDDRSTVGDRRGWVLGDTEAKIDELLARLRAADAELTAAQKVVDRLEHDKNRVLVRFGALRALRGTDWHSVDRDASAREVEALSAQLEARTRDDVDLRDAVALADSALAARSEADLALRDAQLDLGLAETRDRELTSIITELDSAISSGAVPTVDGETTAELQIRFRAVQRTINRSNLSDVGQTVAQGLQREADRASTVAQAATGDIVGLEVQFVERWPTVAADLSATLEDRHGYLEVLADITARGLPDHEGTFQRLLREKSRDLIGFLASAIVRAPRDVEDRILPVNSSLRRSKFDEGRFLRIRVRVRRSESATTFLADLRSISEGQWGDIDLAAAEQRFATLAGIMRRLSSSESIDKTWRTQCLDTRLHVTFLAEEIDENEVAHATYDSGAAMSGGQQQKLVIFCLAAALRYQLADADDPVPKFGTIILDEAFDKADTRYTRMALDVFVEFGFHLVLATPQKLLQTIEPYVGGATAIENPTRARSVVESVPWREVEV